MWPFTKREPKHVHTWNKWGTPKMGREGDKQRDAWREFFYQERTCFSCGAVEMRRIEL